MFQITIDMGTTNTRACLWRDAHVLAQGAAAIGARDLAGASGRHRLEQSLRGIIDAMLAECAIEAVDIALTIASGMIGAGLVDVPHVTAPAGLAELARALQQFSLPAVFDGELWCIPGVRNHAGAVGLHDHEAMDMMRGEETEVMGLLARLPLAGSALIVLPGSHTKIVSIDQHHRIVGCVTTLAGELLQAIIQHTLIGASLEGGFGSRLQPDHLLAGAATARQVGLARACFSVRVLERFGDSQREQLASYLLGAVLVGDVHALKHSSAIKVRPDSTIVICGKPMLRDALALLIEEDRYFHGKHIVVDDAVQANLAGAGALAIAAERELVHGSAP